MKSASTAVPPAAGAAAVGAHRPLADAMHAAAAAAAIPGAAGAAQPTSSVVALPVVGSALVAAAGDSMTAGVAQPARISAALPMLAGVLVAAAVMVWPSRVRRRSIGGPRGRRGARPMPSTRAGPNRGRRGEPGRDGVSATVVMELVAAALRAGLPGPQAVEAAATACGARVSEQLARPLDAWRLGIPADRAWVRVDPEFAPLARSLVLAERTGASAAVLLAAAAADARSARQRRAVVAARRLGVQLVLPLGLTTLPAFVLVGVVPVVLGLATGLLDAG